MRTHEEDVKVDLSMAGQVMHLVGDIGYPGDAHLPLYLLHQGSRLRGNSAASATQHITMVGDGPQLIGYLEL